MSPQFRAKMNNTTTSSSGCDDNVGCSSNPCLGAASSFLASSSSSNHNEFNTLHKISSESTTVTADTTDPLNHATSTTSTDGTSSNRLLLRKRSATRISSSSSPKSPQFLSSYGSAFLSGIFADIAETSSTDGKIQDSSSSCTASSAHNATNDIDVSMMEPSNKKARCTTTSTFNTISRQKSFKVMDGAFPEGADSMVSSPPVVSPRSKTSTVNLNDHVRMLQDMAFPSLPNMPITVSSSSCPSMSSSKIVTPTATAATESDKQDTQEDGPDAYGWFVATDDDMAADSNEQKRSESTTTGFFPDMKPDLAFMALTAPQGGNQEIEVQQALAADTIDDVLGDLF